MEDEMEEGEDLKEVVPVGKGAEENKSLEDAESVLYSSFSASSSSAAGSKKAGRNRTTKRKNLIDVDALPLGTAPTLHALSNGQPQEVRKPTKRTAKRRNHQQNHKPASQPSSIDPSSSSSSSSEISKAQTEDTKENDDGNDGKQPQESVVVAEEKVAVAKEVAATTQAVAKQPVGGGLMIDLSQDSSEGEDDDATQLFPSLLSASAASSSSSTSSQRAKVKLSSLKQSNAATTTTTMPTTTTPKTPTPTSTSATTSPREAHPTLNSKNDEMLSDGQREIRKEDETQELQERQQTDELEGLGRKEAEEKEQQEGIKGEQQQHEEARQTEERSTELTNRDNVLESGADVCLQGGRAANKATKMDIVEYTDSSNESNATAAPMETRGSSAVLPSESSPNVQASDDRQEAKDKQEEPTETEVPPQPLEEKEIDPIPIASQSVPNVCFVCKKSIAYMTAPEKEVHVNGCIDQRQREQLAALLEPDPDFKESILCQVCNKDITKLNIERRQHHLERCIQSLEAASSSTTAGGKSKQKSTKEDASLEPPTINWEENIISGVQYFCPICRKDRSKSKLSARISHLKSCAKKHNVNPTNIEVFRNRKNWQKMTDEAVRRQTKQQQSINPSEEPAPTNAAAQDQSKGDEAKPAKRIARRKKKLVPNTTKTTTVVNAEEEQVVKSKFFAATSTANGTISSDDFMATISKFRYNRHQSRAPLMPAQAASIAQPNNQKSLHTLTSSSTAAFSSTSTATRAKSDPRAAANAHSDDDDDDEDLSLAIAISASMQDTMPPPRPISTSSHNRDDNGSPTKQADSPITPESPGPRDLAGFKLKKTSEDTETEKPNPVKEAIKKLFPVESDEPIDPTPKFSESLLAQRAAARLGSIAISGDRESSSDSGKKEKQEEKEKEKEHIGTGEQEIEKRKPLETIKQTSTTGLLHTGKRNSSTSLWQLSSSKLDAYNPIYTHTSSLLPESDKQILKRRKEKLLRQLSAPGNIGSSQTKTNAIETKNNGHEERKPSNEEPKNTLREPLPSTSKTGGEQKKAPQGIGENGENEQQAEKKEDEAKETTQQEKYVPTQKRIMNVTTTKYHTPKEHLLHDGDSSEHSSSDSESYSPLLLLAKESEQSQIQSGKIAATQQSSSSSNIQNRKAKRQPLPSFSSFQPRFASAEEEYVDRAGTIVQRYQQACADIRELVEQRLKELKEAYFAEIGRITIDKDQQLLELQQGLGLKSVPMFLSVPASLATPDFETVWRTNNERGRSSAPTALQRKSKRKTSKTKRGGGWSFSPVRKRERRNYDDKRENKKKKEKKEKKPRIETPPSSPLFGSPEESQPSTSQEVHIEETAKPALKKRQKTTLTQSQKKREEATINATYTPVIQKAQPSSAGDTLNALPPAIGLKKSSSTEKTCPVPSFDGFSPIESMRVVANNEAIDVNNHKNDDPPPRSPPSSVELPRRCLRIPPSVSPSSAHNLNNTSKVSDKEYHLFQSTGMEKLNDSCGFIDLCCQSELDKTTSTAAAAAGVPEVATPPSPTFILSPGRACYPPSPILFPSPRSSQSTPSRGIITTALAPTNNHSSLTSIVPPQPQVQQQQEESSFASVGSCDVEPSLSRSISSLTKGTPPPSGHTDRLRVLNHNRLLGDEDEEEEDTNTTATTPHNKIHHDLDASLLDFDDSIFELIKGNPLFSEPPSHSTVRANEMTTQVITATSSSSSTTRTTRNECENASSSATSILRLTIEDSPSPCKQPNALNSIDKIDDTATLRTKEMTSASSSSYSSLSARMDCRVNLFADAPPSLSHSSPQMVSYRRPSHKRQRRALDDIGADSRHSNVNENNQRHNTVDDHHARSAASSPLSSPGPSPPSPAFHSCPSSPLSSSPLNYRTATQSQQTHRHPFSSSSSSTIPLSTEDNNNDDARNILQSPILSLHSSPLFDSASTTTTTTQLVGSSSQIAALSPDQSSPPKRQRTTLRPTNGTPRPDYENMSHQELKKEVAKYGVRAGSVRWMREKLVEIWEATHLPQKALPLDSPSVVRSLSIFRGETSKQPVDEEKAERERLLRKKITAWLKENEAVYSQILQYESLDLEALQTNLKEAGLKCSRQFLSDYLNEQGVAFLSKKSKRKRNGGFG